MSNVVQILESAPEQIALLSEKLAQESAMLSAAEHNLKVARAMATVKYAASAKDAKVLDAYVELDEDVKLRQAQVIKAQADYEVAKIQLAKADNQFISARKLMGQQITVSEIP